MRSLSTEANRVGFTKPSNQCCHSAVTEKY